MRNLADIVNESLVNNPYSRGLFTDKQVSLHPSAASVEIDDPIRGTRVIGNCLRREWYRISGYPQDYRDKPEDIRRMALGEWVAECEYQKMLEAGICILRKEHPFQIPELRINGRTDTFVLFDGERVGVEMKSTTQQPFSHPTVVPNNLGDVSPKLEHVCQVTTYAFAFPGIPKWILYYVDLLSKKSRSYEILFNDKFEASIDGQRSVVSWERVRARFDTLLDHVFRKKSPPKRDYYDRYPDDIAKKLFDAGMMTAAKYRDHSRTRTAKIGDSECRWCPYRKTCANDAD